MDLVPIRWAKRFLRADADQPVGTMRMILSLIRRNQWVLLEWRPVETSQFYPVKKGEISTRLDTADAELPVAQVLHLERASSSLTQRTFRSVYSSTETAESQAEPWLRRRVLLDDGGVRSQ